MTAFLRIKNDLMDIYGIYRNGNPDVFNGHLWDNIAFLMDKYRISAKEMDIYRI